MKILLILFSFCLVTSQLQAGNGFVLATSMLAGEVTHESVVMHARLSASDTLGADGFPGQEGWGRFELSTTPAFTNLVASPWLQADSSRDYVLQYKITGLQAQTQYYYRLRVGADTLTTDTCGRGEFLTFHDPASTDTFDYVHVSCYNYHHFYNGNAGFPAASGIDSLLGYPAFAVIAAAQPDLMISNGDNVYYDTGTQADTQGEMRRKWHEQMAMKRMVGVGQHLATYWLKDDHDYRFNDADTAMPGNPSHQLGIATFREQVPVTDPNDPNAVTYRTVRVNRDVQFWFLENRDYRSPNSLADSTNKSIWGATQKAWLQATLLGSDASFKFIITPNPMIGPDDGYKVDNHTNQNGFKTEGEAFFQWLVDNNFSPREVFLICGDRHWQYHSQHPTGFEEFSSGALIDQNSRLGRAPGDPASTDPDTLVNQLYLQNPKSGGFLHVRTFREAGNPRANFKYCDDQGELLYEVNRYAHPIAGEAGTVNTTHVWKKIVFSQSYQNPVLIAGAHSVEGTQECGVRIRNVNSNGAEIRIQEWETCMNGTHLEEHIPWMVMEAGVHTLPNGKTLIAGVEDSVDHQWKQIMFPQAFSAPPTLLTHVSSYREQTLVTSRTDHTTLTGTGFTAQVQEGEGADSVHAPEKLSWIAVEPGSHNAGNEKSFEAYSSATNVTDQLTALPFQQTYSRPIFIGRIESYHESDACFARYPQATLLSNGVQVFAEEEVCGDPEKMHLAERLGYFVFGGVGAILTDTILTSVRPTGPLSRDEYLAVYPNPGSGILHFAAQHALEVPSQLKVWSLLGETLFATELGPGERRSLDISGLVPGIYIYGLHEMNGKKLAAGKIVVR